MQNAGDPAFMHDDRTDYSCAPMSQKKSDLFGGSFTSHCANPMFASNPDAVRKVGNTTIGDIRSLKLHAFMSLHQKGDLKGKDEKMS